MVNKTDEVASPKEQSDDYHSGVSRIRLGHKLVTRLTRVNTEIERSA